MTELELWLPDGLGSTGLEIVGRADSIPAAAARLAPDGLLWVAVPRRSRRAAERALLAAGLAVRGAVLTVPPPPETRHLIQLEPAAVRYAARRHLGLSVPAAEVLTGLARTRLLRRLPVWTAPGCALLAGRAGDAPPMRWLGELDGRGAVAATVSVGPRQDARVATALRFPGPDLAVKVALDAGGVERVAAEARALERLGPQAAAAGARLPESHGCSPPHLAVYGALSGESAAAALARRPRRLQAIAGPVANWLLAWNKMTTVRTSGDPAPLFAPVRRVMAHGLVTEAYRAWLELLLHQPIVRVAAHNDLTMNNLLLDGAGLGVLDWESAAESGLPLTDLWYALVDAVARARRLSHVDAVLALLRGEHAELSRLPARHATALGLAPEQALLGFHACWLAHADDELERGGREGPFCEVVRAVARGQLCWPGCG